MKIESPSRIHITLIDLNGSIGRVDGGVGLALENPKIVIEGKEEDEIIIEGEINKDVEKRIFTTAKKILDYIDERGVYLKVESLIPQHSGLGSGTQISLSVGKLISKIYNKDLDVYEIAKLTGRGGTSGIGIGAFKFGGFLVDGGHSIKEKPFFKPSSASKGITPAPILVRYNFNWDTILIIPKGRHIYGNKEVDIFNKYCPIRLEEVRELSHLILMKILPSIVEDDLESFGEAINRIQHIGFKKVELSLQTQPVKEIIKEIQINNYAGLSSFGPTIYAYGDYKEIKGIVKEIFSKYNIDGDILKVKPNNIGYKIW
ncbi:beta-ribofuranosylaminobenzene 5'-phosphate synthase [Methanocaldococcus indicus]|uniref:beta-ribofuranosylaminobenzene 5'-phosphate synthase n=1 Tax=Methanocaldococcus indicus TaxID=213231 RepID=UPI003C6CE1C1